MKKRGRPSRLTPEVQEKIISAVRRGAYITTACLAAGVTRASYYNWEDWAAEGRQPHAEFFDTLKKAEAEAEIFATDKMRTEKGAFLPEATFLERRFRDRWGRSDRLSVNAEVNMRVEVVNFASHKFGEVIEVEPPKKLTQDSK